MQIDTCKVRMMMNERLLTQVEMAKRSSLSRNTVNLVLLKGSCKPDTVCRIATVLGVEPEEIVLKGE